MEILLATGNGNKVKELQKMLDEQPQSKGWVVKSLRDQFFEISYSYGCGIII